MPKMRHTPRALDRPPAPTSSSRPVAMCTRLCHPLTSSPSSLSPLTSDPVSKAESTAKPNDPAATSSTPTMPAKSCATDSGWGAGTGRRGAVGPGPSALIGRSSCHATRGNVAAVTVEPAILARGPWPVDRIEAVWHDEHFEPPAERAEAADRAITALRERGSPSHDGLAARLVNHSERDGRLVLELQPVRWALRLVEGDASSSMAALCVIRGADGRWLAGRRAAWLSSWAGRWALGAGGAVDPFEHPSDALVRELREEWGVAPERVRAEALVRLPHELVMFVGQAWLAEGAEIVPDDEHDEYAWWPEDPAEWPEEADAPLRRMASLLR